MLTRFRRPLIGGTSIQICYRESRQRHEEVASGFIAVFVLERKGEGEREEEHVISSDKTKSGRADEGVK